MIILFLIVAYLDWVRSIEIATEGHVIHARLGQIVARNFSLFIEANRATPCTDGTWSITKNNFRFEHLHLISLLNVFEVVVDLH